MRAVRAFLLPAMESAVALLERSGLRWEAFARSGETWSLRWRPGEGWDRRFNHEAGVACRVAGGGAAGFAAAAGSAATAGREAARAAVDGRSDGPDPLPPVERLGQTPVAAAGEALDPEAVEAFARALLTRCGGDLAELRLVAGESTAVLATGEGFAGRARLRAAVVEMVLTAGDGSRRLVHTARPTLSGLDPAALAERARSLVGIAPRGGPPRRRLADVLLAPPVASRLVETLGRAMRAEAAARLPLRVSGVWELHDARSDPDGILALPFDGEGLPSRNIPLASGGRLGERLATWSDARRYGASAGGAVRASYREPPVAGPANLVVRSNPATPAAALLERLDDGFYLALPRGELRFEPGTGAFALLCSGLRIRHGRPAAGHAVLELRGSLARLLRGLEATGGDSAGASLTCAVTTPSLLVRGLEVA